MKYEEEITKIIAETICITESIQTFNADSNLQDAGMDSISFIGIIVKIENYFDIKVPPEKLVIDQTATLKDLCGIVRDCIY